MTLIAEPKLPVQPAFPRGTGDMAARIAGHDWAGTPLGPISAWPQSLRTAVEICLASGFPAWVWWGEELTQIYNDAAVAVLRGRHPAALGVPASVAWAEVWDMIGTVALGVLETGQTAIGENRRLLTQRGGPPEEAWFDFSYSALRDERGEVAGLFAIAIETTPNVLAARNHAAERARLVRMYEQAPGFIALIEGPDNRFTIANAAYRALVGRDPVGLPIREALPELAAQGWFELLDRVRTRGEAERGTAVPIRLARGTGGAEEERFIDFLCQPLLDDDGAVTGIFIEGSDVTDRVRTESRLRTLTDNLPVALVYQVESARDMSDRAYVYVSGHCERLTGVPAEQALKSKASLLTISDPDDLARARAAELAAAGDLTLLDIEVTASVQGEERAFQIYSRPRELPSGRLLWDGLLLDVTERHRAEAALQASEERLRDVTDAMPVLISYVDREHRFRFANKAYEAWLGRPLGDVIGRHCREVLGDSMYAVRRPYIERALAGETVTYDGLFAAGPSERQTVIQHIPHLGPDGAVLGFYAMVQDVTDAKRTEAELRDSRDRLQAVLDATPAAIMIAADPECREMSGNARALELMRMPGAPNLSKSDPAAATSHFGVFSFDGRELEPHELPVQRAARGEELWMHEEQVRFDDGSVLDLLGNAVPLRDAAGNLRGAVGAFIDITERNRAERRQKLLIDELNHRVKNTLAVVQGLAQQTFKGTDVPEPLRAAFEGRLSALSVAHELLTRANWEAAAMRQVVRGSLEALGIRAAQVDADGPDLMLPPKTSVSLAMAVHELATNALKYGALSVPEGVVRVRWAVADGRLTFTWTERGGPPVHAPTRRGFGTRMIERGLAAELNGSVRMHFPREGVVCEVDAPAP